MAFFTWWGHLGTTEWLQYTFAKPTVVAGCAVYWFDDIGSGACRVPKSWRVLYRDGNEWKPVASPSGYGVAKDKYNSVTFIPVTTDALRIEAVLQKDFSAGVLEWKVN